jgi:anti-sigma factor RsiW
MNELHPLDDLELYALGLLEDEDRARIDAHLATCDACLRRAGEAEETAASLAALLPRREAVARVGAALQPSRWIPQFAAAAGIVLVLGGALQQNLHLQSELASYESALPSVVHSHFNHVPLRMSPAGSPLAAKVLYAKDGSWIYVVIDGANADIPVTEVVAGRERAAGIAHERNGVAALFVPAAQHPSSVIVRSGGVTGTADLAY